MEKYKIANEKIRLGYEYVKQDEPLKACDIWLSAWEDLKGILVKEELNNIEGLDQKYNWFDFLTNFIQDLELELNNAGQYVEEYHKKRIRYCEEMTPFLEVKDQLTIENTKRAIAESYYALGDAKKCDQLYKDWLNEDPNWGWGYIAWSDCYGFGTNKIAPDQIKAREIIKIALTKPTIRDKADVLMRAIEIYEELGQKEEANKLKEEKRRLEKPLITPAVQPKIGRNEPCPCGSGKKYKRCCGKN